MSGLSRVLHVPGKGLALSPLWLGLRIAGPLTAVLLMFAGGPTTAALASSGWSVEPSSNPAGATSGTLYGVSWADSIGRRNAR